MPIKSKEKKKTTKQVTKPVKKTVSKTVVKKVAPKKKVVKKVVKKVAPKKKVVKKIALKKTIKQEQVIWATGKRKTSIARVIFFSKGSGEIYVNKQPYKKYFNILELKNKVVSPIELLKQADNFQFKIKVQGGGQTGQADAILLGISRALIKFNPDWRKELKAAGFLKRDARKKERKKPGLKRARRAPQWKKR